MRDGTRGGRCSCTTARTGIFFCVTTTTLSFPLTPMDVTPTDLIALKAYSARKGDGEKGWVRKGKGRKRSEGQCLISQHNIEPKRRQQTMQRRFTIPHATHQLGTTFPRERRL